MNDTATKQKKTQRLNPDKLCVEFRRGVTPTEPIIERHYTLTHSDITADLFLTIAPEYALDKVTPMRDEVLAKWCAGETGNYLYGYVYVDGPSNPAMTAIRDRIFRQELPLALEVIYYGDREFFRAHPELNQTPIGIYFDSADPQYNKYEYWGTPLDYRVIV